MLRGILLALGGRNNGGEVLVGDSFAEETIVEKIELAKAIEHVFDHFCFGALKLSAVRRSVPVVIVVEKLCVVIVTTFKQPAIEG